MSVARRICAYLSKLLPPFPDFVIILMQLLYLDLVAGHFQVRIGRIPTEGDYGIAEVAGPEVGRPGDDCQHRGEGEEVIKKRCRVEKLTELNILRILNRSISHSICAGIMSRICRSIAI